MTGISERHLCLLGDRGIDAETAVKHGVESCVKRSGGEWIRIPYVFAGRVVNWKYRTIEGEKEFHQEAGGKKCFWNMDALTDASLEHLPLIITEGEMDAMVAIQSGFPRTVSVPDGAPAEQVGPDDRGAKYTYVAEAKGALRDAREIILAVDNDAAGINLLNDLAIRLGKARCKWVRYPAGCKDLNDVLNRFGDRAVVQAISQAQFMRVDGIYRMSELPPVPPRKPHNLGLRILSDHYNVRPCDFCVVTGIPSHGKSSFINEIAVRMALHHGWTSAFASFEQQPQTDHRRNLRTRIHHKPVAWQTAEEINTADAWIDENFSFIVPSEDDDVTLEWVLDRLASSIIQHNARLGVIDPWNEMDHDRPRDMSLTEYVGFAIKQFRKLALKYQIHLIVAAHPTKQRKDDAGSYQVPTLYDISDSAHWYNKADAGIVVHRMNPTRTLIRVAKSRHHDEIGVPGDVLTLYDRQRALYTIIEETDGARP